AMGSRLWSGQEWWQRLGSRLGWGVLPGNRFSWVVGEGGIVLTGQGAGHGVGMCQWGSRGLALLGKDYGAILRYYCPGTSLQTV
ncbi:MAG: hypothetical protein Q6K99_10990, partial [Thermostichales cyanobacterium BF4_bins_65]